MALGAKVKLVSAKGSREVPVKNFFVTPKEETTREIALRPDEILTEILVPAAAPQNATYEVRQKEALDWPLAAAAVALTMKGTAVASAKIVLGHVAPTPWEALAADKVSGGQNHHRRDRRSRGQGRGGGRPTAQPEHLQGATGPGSRQTRAARGRQSEGVIPWNAPV